MSRETVGQIDCLCCGREIPAKMGAAGALSVCCPWCDFSAYAKKGTEAARIIAKRIREAFPDDQPAPAEKPKAPAAKVEAPKVEQPAPPAPPRRLSLLEQLQGVKP